MSKAITDIDDPRLVKALSHPLRVKIMALLERRSATPKELATELGVPLENLSYHVRALRNFGFLELEDVRMVRGALEHRYRLAAQPRITPEAWEELPAVVRDALDAAALGQIWEIVGRAAAQGKLDEPQSHVSRHLTRLDETGFAEASELISATVDRLVEIEQASAARLAKGQGCEVAAYVITMLFGAPEAGDAEGSE